MKLYGRSATPRTVEILIRQRIPPTSEVRTIVECADSDEVAQGVPI